MAGGFPDVGVHDDGGVESYNIVAHLDHVSPPGVFDIPFKFDAQGAVVEKTIATPINFRGVENEAPALA